MRLVNPWMVPAKPALLRPNPFMTPARPALVRPNPKRRKNPFLPAKMGKISGPLAGSALATASDLVLDTFVPAAWQIPTHLGVGVLSMLLPSGPVTAGFAGAHFYAGLMKLLVKATTKDIMGQVAAAVAT